MVTTDVALSSSEPHRPCPAVDPLALALLFGAGLAAERKKDRPPPPVGAASVYRAACAGCHGEDGKGMPLHVVGFDTPLPPGEGPWQIAVELVYQPIGRRWALNLAKVDAVEPRRFVGYYRAMAASSSEVLARASVRWSPRAGAP